MSRDYAPDRGHIVFTDFDPAAGHEQKLKRPAIILSPGLFNRKMQLALVAPITSRVRGHGFEVLLEGTHTTGVVLCHQVKVIDYRARGIRFVEEAPQAIVETVLAKVRVLVQ